MADGVVSEKEKGLDGHGTPGTDSRGLRLRAYSLHGLMGMGREWVWRDEMRDDPDGDLQNAENGELKLSVSVH